VNRNINKYKNEYTKLILLRLTIFNFHNHTYGYLIFLFIKKLLLYNFILFYLFNLLSTQNGKNVK